MDGSAKVRSVDAIEQFKAGLTEFGELGQRALGEAESDIQRTIWWLKNDQTFHWRSQKKKRAEKLAQAKSELFRAQLSADQDNRSTTTERRALEKAEKALEEADWKLDRISYWVKTLEREAIIYKGHAQQMGNALALDVPSAAAKLENMIRIIEEYIQITPPRGTEPKRGHSDSESSISRGGEAAAALPKIRDLRDAAPRQSRRDAAELLTPPARPPIEPPPPLDLGRFEPAAPSPPESGDRIVVEDSALAAERIFLERSQTIVNGDSGWYLGCVSRAGTVEHDPAFRAMVVEDVLDQRPEFASVLALPRGSVLVIQGGTIEEMWNDRSRIWPRQDEAAASKTATQERS